MSVDTLWTHPRCSTAQHEIWDLTLGEASLPIPPVSMQGQRDSSVPLPVEKAKEDVHISESKQPPMDTPMFG